MAAANEESPPNPSGPLDFTIAGQPAVKTIMRIRAFAFRECCLRSASRSGVALPPSSGPKWNDAKLARGRIPTRRYAIGRLVLETVLGCLPVSEPRAQQLVAMVGQFERPGLVFLASACLFLSAIVATLTSTSEVRVDVSILGVLIIAWGLVHYLSKWIVERKAMKTAAAFPAYDGLSSASASVGTALDQSELRRQSKSGRPDTMGQGFFKDPNLVVQRGGFSSGGDASRLAWFADAEPVIAPRRPTFKGARLGAADFSPNVWDAVGPLSQSQVDVQCARINSGGFSAKEAGATDVADSMLWLLDLSVTNAQPLASDPRSLYPGASGTTDRTFALESSKFTADLSLQQLMEMFFEQPGPSELPLTVSPTNGTLDLPSFMGEAFANQAPVAEPLVPVDPVTVCSTPASSAPALSEPSGSEALVRDELHLETLTPESLVPHGAIAVSASLVPMDVPNHISSGSNLVDGTVVGELLALIDNCPNDPFPYYSWTMEKLNRFLSEDVPWTNADMFKIIEATASHLISYEATRLRTPGVDAFEADPYLPPVAPKLEGDVATYRSVIVGGNLVWDFIDSLVPLFIRFNLVHPTSKWTHRTACPQLNVPLRQLFSLEVLLDLAGFTLEVLDGGLSLLDLSMKPKQPSPASSPRWMSLATPSAIEKRWNEELGGEDPRLDSTTKYSDQCSGVDVSSTVPEEGATASCRRHPRHLCLEPLPSRSSRSMSDTGLDFLGDCSCDREGKERVGSGRIGESLDQEGCKFGQASPEPSMSPRRGPASDSPHCHSEGLQHEILCSSRAVQSAQRRSESITERAKARSDMPLFHACLHLDMNRAKSVIRHLQMLFFNLVGGEPVGERKDQKRLFLERLTRSYLLVGDSEAISIGKEIVATYLGLLSVECGARCLLSAKRSPIGPQFSDAVERLYHGPFDEAKQDSSQFIKDRLWPILIDCRVHWKMYSAALSLLDVYCKDGKLLPAHYGPSVIQLGVECERIDLINSEINRHQKLDNLQSYMQVIRTLGRKHDVAGAVRVLHQLEADEHLAPDLPIYNVVLDVCVSNRKLAVAEGLFRSMQTSKSIDIVSYNIMIKGYCQSGELSTACNMLQSMRLDGFRPDGFSYNSLISAAATTGEMDLAWRLIAEMKENSIDIDRYTCSIMVKQLRPSCSPRDRQKLLSLVENIDVCEDTILFSTVVDACARLKDIRRLRMALDRFNQSGLRPNGHAYGTLIKAHGRCEEVEKAWELWREMTEIRKLEPSNYAFGCMLDTLVSNARLDEAIQLLKGSVVKGRPANNVQYSILIKGCAKAKRVDQALALYQEMLDHGIECNEVIYNSLINVCGISGHLEKAEIILNQMIQAPNCQPDVISYSSLIKGFCTRGDMVRAFQLFHQMIAGGIQPDGILFNTLLEGCAKQSLLEVAEQVLQQMLASQTPMSSFTLTTLIKLYGRAHLLSKALEVAEEFPKKFDFELDGFVYTALVAACLTNNAVDKALEFFHKLNQNETRSVVSGRTFGTIIVGCTNAERLFVAYDLLSDAHDRGLEVGSTIVLRLRQRLAVKQFHTPAGRANLAPFLPGMIAWLGDVGAYKLRGTAPRIPVALREVAEAEDRAAGPAKQVSSTQARNGQGWNSLESIPPPPPSRPYHNQPPSVYSQGATCDATQVLSRGVALNSMSCGLATIPAPPTGRHTPSGVFDVHAVRRAQSVQQPFPAPSSPFQQPIHQFPQYVTAGQQWHFVPCIQPSPGAQCHVQPMVPQFYAPIGTYNELAPPTTNQGWVAQGQNVSPRFW